VKGICDSLCQTFTGQRVHHDLLCVRPRFADRFQLEDQMMGRINFFVAIRTDQHQVPKIRLNPHAQLTVGVFQFQLDAIRT
jgi:hypothetical protein